MAWTAPTVADFKARFPNFASVDDATVQIVLDEAVGEVGSTWIEKDRTPAVLHLTAHMLASEGLGVPSPGGGGAAVTGAVKRRRVGDTETEFVGMGGNTSNGPLSGYLSTAYGRRYLELMRRNFPAIAVV